METSKEKVSYCIGMEAGKNLKGQFADLDEKLMMEGFQDGLSGSASKVSQEETRELLTALQEQIQKQQQEYVSKVSKQNKIAGEAFLSENKNKEGVVTLASGLQYLVIDEGNGETPKLNDLVLTHYKGEFIDGNVFDNSYERGKPQPFPVNQVIPGWSEALQLMKPGAKWKLFVPSYLAYGETGFQREIPPNATLIFEMELLEVNPSEENAS